MGNKPTEYFDDLFYRLVNEVNVALSKNKDGTNQEQQFTELIEAEVKFKEAIFRYRQATEIYKRFLQKICVENKNILSARPYFRESAITFSKEITPAIKSRNIDELKKFNINYQLIKFIKDTWLGPFPKKAEVLFKKVELARTKLIENNMPLAINRAKIFYRKTPKSHLTLTDMITICGMGLAAGVDKFCGKYTPVFNGVCIGRMTGNLINSYSETMLHFYPSDKRIIYKALSIRGRQGIEDVGQLSEAVNESFKQDQLEGKSIPKEKVTTSHLNNLLSAASTVSADTTVNEEGFNVYHFTVDSSDNIEKDLIERDTLNHILTASKNLSIMERKILRLKGIKL